MALLFSDGFDSYAATADLNKKWSRYDSWTWNAGADQNGASGGILTATAAGSLLLPVYFTPNASRVGAGFWVKVSAAPAAVSSLCILYNDIGATQGFLQIFTTGVLRLLNNLGGGPVLTGATNICDNAWHWIEWMPQVGTNALQRCIVDSTSQWNGAGTMMGTGTLEHINFNAVAGRTISLSDVMIYDDSGPSFTTNDFPLGARKITTKRPDGDDAVQFTRSTGASSFALVDEVNGDVSDYVESSTVGQQDTYDYAALGFTPTTVNAVVVNSFVQAPGPGTVTFVPVAKSGSVEARGQAQAIAAFPNVRQQPFYLDPNTGAAWTEAAINAAKFGVRVNDSMVLRYIGRTHNFTNSTFTVYIGEPAPDRHVVIALACRRGSFMTLNSVTIDGTLMWLSPVTGPNNEGFSAIAYLKWPLNSFATIVANYSSTFSTNAIDVFTITNGGNLTVVDTAFVYSDATGTASDSTTLAATPPTVVIGTALGLLTAFGAFTWTGLFKQYDYAIYSSGGTVFGQMSSAMLLTTSTSPLSISAANSSAYRGLVAAAFTTYTTETAPTIVQARGLNKEGGAVTMSPAPTQGNLLVALNCHFSNSPAAAAGWTLMATVNGTDGTAVFTKLAGAGESTSQTPTSTSTLRGSMVIFEIANAFAFDVAIDTIFAAQGSASAASYSHTETTRGTNELIVGIAEAISNQVPTMSGTGVTTDVTGTDAAAPRGFAGFHVAAPTAGSYGVTASFSPNSASSYIAVSIRPKQA